MSGQRQAYCFILTETYLHTSYGLCVSNGFLNVNLPKVKHNALVLQLLCASVDEFQLD